MIIIIIRTSEDSEDNYKQLFSPEDLSFLPFRGYASGWTATLRKRQKCQFDVLKTQMDKYYIIKNPTTGMVLDAATEVVCVQQRTGFSVQFWKLEHADYGRFFIHNKGNPGKVLDIERQGKKAGKVLLAKKEDGNFNQLWHINSDGTIACANGDDFALDISTKDKTQKLILYPRSGYDNQRFELCEKTNA